MAHSMGNAGIASGGQLGRPKLMLYNIKSAPCRLGAETATANPEFYGGVGLAGKLPHTKEAIHPKTAVAF